MSGHPGYKMLLDEMWDLHCLKASHYGTAEDPLANLRQSTDIGIEAWRACVGEAKNAFFRVTNHCKNGHLPESSMIDALKDVAAFSMLALLFIREEREKQHVEVADAQFEYEQAEQNPDCKLLLNVGEDEEQAFYEDPETERFRQELKVEAERRGYRPPSEEIGNKMTEVLEKAK